MFLHLLLWAAAPPRWHEELSCGICVTVTSLCQSLPSLLIHSSLMCFSALFDQKSRNMTPLLPGRGILCLVSAALLWAETVPQANRLSLLLYWNKSLRKTLHFLQNSSLWCLKQGSYYGCHLWIKVQKQHYRYIQTQYVNGKAEQQMLINLLNRLPRYTFIWKFTNWQV